MTSLDTFPFASAISHKVFCSGLIKAISLYGEESIAPEYKGFEIKFPEGVWFANATDGRHSIKQHAHSGDGSKSPIDSVGRIWYVLRQQRHLSVPKHGFLKSRVKPRRQIPTPTVILFSVFVTSNAYGARDMSMQHS